MRTFLGIDVGSVSCSFVLINECGAILQSDYRFHRGQVEDTLKEMLSPVSFREVRGIGATTSTPESFTAGIRFDNQVAVITSARHLHPETGSILVVGGEKFGLIRFNEEGSYSSFSHNTSCAAGTGSFLDQQAGRLNLKGIEEFCRVAESNRDPIPKIATRCAVFAKTDLIHAQQEGYDLPAICDGLSQGLAKNIVDTLFCSEKVHLPLLFCGGVSLNPVVAHHIENLTGFPITVDEWSHLYGALGAALGIQKEQRGNEQENYEINELFSIREAKRNYYHEPLDLKLSHYPDFSSLKSFIYKVSGNSLVSDVEVDIYKTLPKICKSWLGADIGSTSTKAVLLDESGDILAGFYTRTAGSPLQALQGIFEAIDDISRKESIDLRIRSSGTTGSGRKFIGRIIGADLILDEITAHARAARELDPEVDTIIEIGGQDSKFTTLRKGIVTSSTMNNVCAAGTGSFLEEQAKKLGCKVTDYSKRTIGQKAPLSSDRCTVFMERDLNHFLSEGYSIDEVLGSAIHSVRENYLLKVATEGNIGNRIFFQGATAKNRALVAAFEQKLKKPILVSKYCHLTGALGVALQLLDDNSVSDNFRGIRLYKEEIPLRPEVCDLCTNHCKITVATVRGETVAYGFLCGRDYDTKRFINNNRSGFDLLAERKRILNASTNKSCRFPFTIGIPAALYLVEDLILWTRFFDLLGIKTISSESLKNPAKLGNNFTGAEFCAPIAALHGHVNHLLKTTDYLFLPYYLEEKRKKREIKRKYCYYTQYAPAIIQSRWNSDRILSPLIRHRYTNFHTKAELYRMLQGIEGCNVTFLEVSGAYDETINQIEKAKEKLKDLFPKFLPEQADDIQVVLLGRPYTVLSPSMNNGIPDIFGSLGIRTYYQDMVPITPEDTENIGPLLTEIHWNYAAKIVETAEAVARMEGVYPVLITSFKCSPDSYITTYLKKLLDSHDKPYLILELDEQDSSVGYETRIEAAVRAFRNHAEAGQQGNADLNGLMPGMLSKLKGKTLLMPNWDNISLPLVVANLQKEGYDVKLLDETDEIIRRSLRHNTGQCIPMNAIVEGYIDYIEQHGLKPSKTVLWLPKSECACNIPLFPYHIQTILKDYGNGMEKAGVYTGDLSFADFSPTISLNAYFAFMFGGYIRRMGCRLRPYEIEKGKTDRVITESVNILLEAFKGNRKKDEAAGEVIDLFESIEVKREKRPKVAIFGDLYVRDNEIMNQDLIRFIEEQGGEVITTPYSEYAKIIASTSFRRMFKARKYKEIIIFKSLLAVMKTLEKSYYQQFSRILRETGFSYDEPGEEILKTFGLKVEHSGESAENILKIYYLKKHFPDISLFVQTNPAFCCPGIVTEAMRKQIEEITGVPVVSVTYDGTGGNKNEAIIPYLKFPGKSRTPGGEKEKRQIG